MLKLRAFSTVFPTCLYNLQLFDSDWAFALHQHHSSTLSKVKVVNWSHKVHMLESDGTYSFTSTQNIGPFAYPKCSTMTNGEGKQDRGIWGEIQSFLALHPSSIFFSRRFTKWSPTNRTL